MTPQPLSDRWERGNLYEQYIGRWSRQVAPAFLAWLNCAPGLRWLDVGCGTGSLCAAIAAHCAPAWVGGLEPSGGFLEAARAALAGQVAFARGSAAAIPLADNSVDGVVCGLVLNFVPDARVALGEMIRVTRPGGTIAAYLWDYAGKMELIRLFWDAAVELDPAAARLDEGLRFPLCRPAALRDLFADAGLSGVALTAIDIPTHFASFAEYWQPFLGGQGPAPAYTLALAASDRARLHDALRRRTPLQPDGSISLTARAWAVRGRID